MAYEVTKIVNGRAYRYSVRSERQPETGKFRNRWTYLGRADAAGATAPARKRRNARTALLDALERLLLVSSDPNAVTAAAVSAEAGVAHGTFYRYFRNKTDAIIAIYDRVRTSRSADFAALEALPETPAEARAALRGWVTALLRARDRHVGLLRAIDLLSAGDDVLDAHKRQGREMFVARLSAYLATLDACGFARIADPAAAAAVLVPMLGGIFREAIFSGPIDEAHLAATVDLMERAIFGTLL